MRDDIMTSRAIIFVIFGPNINNKDPWFRSYGLDNQIEDKVLHNLLIGEASYIIKAKMQTFLCKLINCHVPVFKAFKFMAWTT